MFTWSFWLPTLLLLSTVALSFRYLQIQQIQNDLYRTRVGVLRRSWTGCGCEYARCSEQVCRQIFLRKSDYQRINNTTAW